MERMSLGAVTRSAIGKNAVKKTRRDGFVPAILYGRTREPLPVAVGRKELAGVLATGRNVLIDLTIAQDGGPLSDTVMIREIQQDYVRREILHVDLHQISMTEALEVDVPVVLVGTPEGVASGGGILELHRREVTIRCLPTQIPDRLTVSVAGLGVGGALHVRELEIPEGLEVLTPPEEVLAAVVAPREEEVAATVEAEAPAQPELVGRAAEEEEAAATATAAPRADTKAEKKE